VSISDDGNTVAMGAWGNDDGGDDAGYVRVYTFGGSEWVKLGADLLGEAADDALVRSCFFFSRVCGVDLFAH
jgi:hypothetical protein